MNFSQKPKTVKMKFLGKNLNFSKIRLRGLSSLEYRLNRLASNLSIRFTIDDLRKPSGFHILKKQLHEESLKILVVDIGASIDEFESPYYDMFDGFQSIKVVGFDPLTDKTPLGRMFLYIHS